MLLTGFLLTGRCIISLSFWFFFSWTISIFHSIFLHNDEWMKLSWWCWCPLCACVNARGFKVNMKIKATNACYQRILKKQTRSPFIIFNMKKYTHTQTNGQNNEKMQKASALKTAKATRKNPTKRNKEVNNIYFCLSIFLWVSNKDEATAL